MFRKRLKWNGFVDMEMIRFLAIPLIVLYLSKLIAADEICPPCKNAEEIQGYKNCPSLVTVNSSLVIKHLAENVEHKTILNTHYGNCELFVVMQDPNEEYVKIDKKTNMLTSIAFDRESEEFSGMLVPQIQVQLELDCKNGIPNAYTNDYDSIEDLVPNSRWSHPTKYKERSYVLTGDIGFTPGKIMLSIIIEDVNDNKPEFKYPPSNFQIGYPESAISEEIFLDYLLKVVAKDNDAGLNAQIRYTVHPNEHFRINPVTGEIIPITTAMQNKETFLLKVIATDRNGADDGKQSTTDIMVHKVSTKHIVLLTVERQTQRKVYKAIKTLQELNNMEIRFLRKGFVSTPSAQIINGTKEAKSTVTLKAWIYAFDGNKELLDSKIIIEKISEKNNGNNGIVTVPYKGMQKATDVHNSPKSQDGGYFIVIVVTVGLSSAIAVIIVVGIIHWFVYRRNRFKRMSTPSDTGTTISTISNDDDNDSPHHSHIYLKKESLSRKKNSILKRSSSESAEDIERFARKVHHILGDISEGPIYTPDMDIVRPSDKRKSSVTFNDEVKCINIGEDNKVEETISVRL